MKKIRYFDSRGNEVDEHIACDRNVLRSGFSARTPMTMKDAMRFRDAGTGSTIGQWPEICAPS